MIFQCFPTSFMKQCLEGIHDFRVGGHVFKLALYTSAATLNSLTTAYTVTNEVQAGTGYTAGGMALTNLGTNSAGTIGFASFATATWSPASFIAGGGLIYNSTPANTYVNPAVAVLSFGMDRGSVSNQFVISFPLNDQNNAIIRFNSQVP